MLLSKEMLKKQLHGNQVIATVSSTGLVTLKSEGSVTITATSTADSTKSASVTFSVVDTGFDESFLEYGYTYSKVFPVDVIKEFLGEGSYKIVEPQSLVGGCYYCVFEEDEEGPACIEIVVDGIIYETYAQQLLKAGFDKVYNTSTGIEAVDPTKLYTLAVGCNYDEDTYEELAPTYLDFYKSSDVWEPDTLTEDESWNPAHYSADSEGYEAVIESYLKYVPFVKMGASYEINFVDNSLIRALLEAFGMDSSDYPDEFYICDYCLNDSVFDGYGTTLEKAGFKKYSDEYGDYYELVEGIDSVILYTMFGEGGNTIYVEKGPAILDAWPTETVNSFVTDTLGSKYSLPAYDKSENALFSMSINSEEYEDGPFTYAEIDVSDVALSEAESYFADLEQEGFKVVHTESSETEYGSWDATKGKIELLAYFIEDYDYDTDEYDPNHGSLIMMLALNEYGHEEQGVYLPEEMTVVLADGAFTLNPEVVEIENPEFVLTAGTPDIVSIDGLTVTPLAAGETELTLEVVGSEFSSTMQLTIREKSWLESAYEEMNLWLESEDAEPLSLPLIKSGYAEGYYDDYYECYSILVETDVSSDEYLEALYELGFEVDTVDLYAYNDFVEI